jgi:hypothetical protein
MKKYYQSKLLLACLNVCYEIYVQSNFQEEEEEEALLISETHLAQSAVQAA